jgi:hypothetical protein
MKILPVGADLLRADRETNKRTDISAFRIIANAPKNYYITCIENKVLTKSHQNYGIYTHQINIRDLKRLLRLYWRIKAERDL